MLFTAKVLKHARPLILKYHMLNSVGTRFAFTLLPDVFVGMESKDCISQWNGSDPHSSQLHLSAASYHYCSIITSISFVSEDGCGAGISWLSVAVRPKIILLSSFLSSVWKAQPSTAAINHHCAVKVHSLLLLMLLVFLLSLVTSENMHCLCCTNTSFYERGV